MLFPFVCQGFLGFGTEKNHCFLWGFVVFLLQRKQGLEGQGDSDAAQMQLGCGSDVARTWLGHAVGCGCPLQPRWQQHHRPPSQTEALATALGWPDSRESIRRYARIA